MTKLRTRSICSSSTTLTHSPIRRKPTISTVQETSWAERTSSVYPEPIASPITKASYLVVFEVFESNLFSPIFRPSWVSFSVVDGNGSPFRFTDGAARMVSCAHSLHGLFETLEFFGVVDEDFLGATVGTVVAERLDDIWASCAAWVWRRVVGILSAGGQPIKFWD